MNAVRNIAPPLTWPQAALFMAGAIVCFHAAYSSTDFAPLHLAIIGYVICLVQLARLKTTRRTFYAGLITALLCVGPQLFFFWNIFGPAAIALWAILALWIAAFTGMTGAALRRFGPRWTALLIPFLWTGLEYSRSELYYLKFSWMNVGYAFSDWQLFPFHIFGIYGIGFVAAICGAAFLLFRPLTAAFAGCLVIVLGNSLLPGLAGNYITSKVCIAGVQMEFPVEADIPRALDALVAEHPDADLLVLSEYTLLSTEYTQGGPIPTALKNWCRKNHRYLVVGGKEPAPKNNFYNTAFVVGTNGEIVFRQVKSVPIQFFKDGLPAPKQEVWDSPWGKIGFCVCYDLSYTRIIDHLVKMGAQLIIVPTMDVIDWGERQHQLHTLVAPVRAAEYHIPIFRLASSGISQAVTADGSVRATAPFGGEGKSLFATLHFSPRTSIPLDRSFAPLAAAITGIVLVILCLPNRRRNIPGKTESPKSANQPATQNEVLADIKGGAS